MRTFFPFLILVLLTSCIFKPLEVDPLVTKWNFVNGKEFQNGVFIKDTINTTAFWQFRADGFFIESSQVDSSGFSRKGKWKNFKDIIELKFDNVAVEKWQILNLTDSLLSVKRIESDGVIYEWNLKHVNL